MISKFELQFCLFVILSSTILLALIRDVNCESNISRSIEGSLRVALLNNYDKVAFPVKTLNAVVQTKIDVALNQVVDVNEKHEQATLYIWFRMYWKDEWLVWNTSEYNISEVSFHADEVWNPDLTIYNQISGSNNRKDYPIRLKSNGEASWLYPAVSHVSCGMNVRYFPFDTQVCKLVIASWTFPDTYLNISASRINADLTNFIPNGGWNVRGMLIRRHENKFSISSSAWPDVTFSIIMQRRYMHYVWNLVMPCIALLGLHSLCFFLPPESGEKISLGVTALLAFTVYLLMVSDSLPPHSEPIPIMGRFFGISIVLMTLANMSEVISMNLYYRFEFGYRPPNWLRKCTLNGLTRWLYGNKAFPADLSDVEDVSTSLDLNINEDVKVVDSNGAVNSRLYPENGIKEIDAEKLKYEWSMVALIINRISMIVFVFGCIMNTTVLFLASPQFEMPNPDDKKGY